MFEQSQDIIADDDTGLSGENVLSTHVCRVLSGVVEYWLESVRRGFRTVEVRWMISGLSEIKSQVLELTEGSMKEENKMEGIVVSDQTKDVSVCVGMPRQ